MLKKEFQYYLENQTELAKEYEGKFLVIKDLELKGVFDSELDAYSDAISKFELGTFLIQKCEEGDQTLKQTYHTRVAFN